MLLHEIPSSAQSSEAQAAKVITEEDFNKVLNEIHGINSHVVE